MNRHATGDPSQRLPGKRLPPFRGLSEFKGLPLSVAPVGRIGRMECGLRGADWGEAQDVHALWDALVDFDGGQSEAAFACLAAALAAQSGVTRVTWAGAVRLSDGARAQSDDVMRRWRVGAARSIGGPVPPPHRIYDQPVDDPSMAIPLRDLGRFRHYSFRRELPAAWFDAPFYREHYGAHGIVDAGFVAFPVNADCESHFGFWAGRVLEEETIARLAYALRGIKWFHRRLMLGHGLLLASSPLTPTEHRVTELLLTEATEKLIAHRLGLAQSTTHQHIVTIYRKFGVRSRVELMGTWLNRRPQARA